MGARLEFGILGPLEVRRDGASLRVGGPRQRALLALLLCNANRVVSRERLIDELFGDRTDASAERSLRVQISRLRKALDEGGVEPRLPARPPGYVLRVEDGELDLHEFERLVAAGRQALEHGEAERAVELLREAVALWRGRPLADLEFEPFARFEVQRLEELRVLVVEERIDAELALGRHAALCPELEALVEEHPLRERLRAQLMLALYRSGRQADALESYRAGRSRLVEELALEPSPQLRRLERAILEQDPTLELPRPAARTAVGLTETARGHQAVLEEPGSEPALGPGNSYPGRPATAGKAARSRLRGLIAALVGIGLIVVAITAVVISDAAGGGGITAVANSVEVINPHQDRVVAQISVGAEPDGIAVGAGGIWVANIEDHTLSNIDPSTRNVVRTLSVGGTVDGVAADAGALWTLDLTNHGSARRIDPTFGTVIRTVKLSPFYGTLPASPTAIAVSGNSAWFADNAAAVVRIANGGSIVSTTNVGNHPSGIAVGAGATWVADDTEDTVSKLDSTGGVSAVIPVGRGASGIAVGDGAVWVADTLDNSLVRIDPGTDSVTTTIPVGTGPRGVAWGDGSVWVANSGDGTVSRIDPRTDRVTATIPVGQSPQALAVANGAVWVTVQARAPAVIPAPGSPPRVLRVSREGPFPYLDPTRVGGFDQDENQLFYQTCAGLLTYPDRPGAQGERLVPEVAQALPTVSADGRTYSFTVRSGFRFSPPSGAPVTAATFKHTIDRMLSPGVESYERGFFGDIVGETAYNAGKIKELAGVIAHGDKLQIRLTAPAPDLPARLAMLSFCAVPDDTPDTPQTQPIPSAGPFYIASSSPQQLILKRNPNYGGHRPRVPREIIYSFGEKYANAVRDVAAGRIDYVSSVQLAIDANIARSTFQSLQQRYGPESAAARAGRQRYFVNPTVTLDFFALNTRRPLFSSTRVRQAVNYAIDRQALAAVAGPVFGGEPISHYLPPGMPGSRPDAVYPLGTPDLATARKLAVGIHAHATMLTCNTAVCVQTAQIVQSELSKIGISVDITSLPIDAMSTRMVTTNAWDIGWVTFSYDYADPSDYISGLFDPSLGPGFGGLDPRWMKAIRYAYTVTGARRLETYGRLDDALARQDAPILAWDTQSARDFFAPRVGCQIYQPIYGIDLGSLCFRP